MTTPYSLQLIRTPNRTTAHLNITNRKRSMALRSWVAALICCSICSCGVTKFTYKYAYPSKVHITGRDNILVAKLPGNHTERQSRRIIEIFDKKGLTAKYEIAEEWDLQIAGLEFPIDTDDFHLLINLGYTHLLQLRNVREQNAQAFSYFTPCEVSLEENMLTHKPTLENTGNSSEIHLTLFALDDAARAYTVTVFSNIGHTTLRQKDRGEMQINLSDQEMARNKAISKGVRRMLKDCFHEQ